MRGGCADAGDSGRGIDPAGRTAGHEDPCGECRGSDETAARQRAPARALRPRLRLTVHAGQAHHLRLPRLSLAHPSPRLPPPEPREPARARLQGGRHDHDPLRHDGTERHGSLPPRPGRHRSSAAARRTWRLPQGRNAQPLDRASPVHHPPWRGHATGARLALARASTPGPAKTVRRPGPSRGSAASSIGAPFSAAAALLLCVAGCSLISVKSPERPLSSRDLNARVLTREFSYHFIAVVAQCADDIAAHDSDPEVLANALRWKIGAAAESQRAATRDRKSTRLNSSHQIISYAVFCLKKKKNNILRPPLLPNT